MIKSFNSRETEKIWEGNFSKGYPGDIQNMARKKLRMLNNSYGLSDLRIPPSNRLEKLKGDRRGQHNIRINNQWRICLYGKTTIAIVLRSLIITNKIGGKV